MRIVVDASVAVEYLLRTELGQRLEEHFGQAALFAPELVDVEVVAVLRKAVLKRQLPATRAEVALGDLTAWPIERIPHRLLAHDAWRFRNNVSAYDAFYVAAARHCDARVVTADGPLSRAPSLGVVIENVRV